MDFVQSRLKNLRFSSEANIPFKLGVDNVLTVGAEFTDSKLDDPASNSQSLTDRIPGGPGRLPRVIVNTFPGVSEHRGSKTSQRNWAAYIEDNISLTGKTHLIPALRFDHNSVSGGNWSPALNFSQQIGENWLIKGGIARAYKAPNLYQSNPEFILYTRGLGCPLAAGGRSLSCYYMGNANLKPETSVNKEIGAEFTRNGWQASPPISTTPTAIKSSSENARLPSTAMATGCSNGRTHPKPPSKVSKATSYCPCTTR